MSKVYDHDTKQWVNLEDSDVTGKVASGRYAFEDGVKVPVVSPDGKIGTIDSAEARKAFSEGFRWATREDSERSAIKKNKQVLVDHYDDPGKAFVTGTLRGATLGASDVIIPAMAGLSDSPTASDDVREALGVLKKENPISSTAGLVTGSLAGGGLSPVALGGKAAYKAGAGLASSPGRAMITGGAVEGAFYGLGDGISEAALGDAEGVVDNMAAVGKGTITGALFGGGFGALMAGARPLTQAATSLGGKAIHGVQGLGEKIGQKAVGRTVRASLSAKGEAELAKIAGDLAGNPAVRRAYMDGGSKAVRTAIREAKKLSTQAARHYKEEAKSIQHMVKRVPKEQAEEITAAIKKSGDNVLEAKDRLYADIDADYKDFEALVANSDGPGVVADKVYDIADGYIRKLEKSGDPASRGMAKDLVRLLEQNATPAIYNLPKGERGAALRAALTDGQEHGLALELRRIADKSVFGTGGKVPPMSKGVLKNFRRALDDKILKKSEKFGKAQTALDNKYEAYSRLKDFVDTKFLKRLKGSGLVASEAKMIKQMMQPENSGQLSVILNNLGEFVPEMQVFAKQYQSAADKQVALRAISDKIKDFGGYAPHERMQIDMLEGLFKKIGGLDTARIDKLKGFKTAIDAAEEMTPLSKYMALKRALGEPIEAELEALAKFEPSFNALRRMEDIGIPPSEMEQTVSKIAQFKAAKLPVGGTGAVIGGVVGGVPGAIVGAGIDLARTAKNNPVRLLEALTTAEKVSRKGANLLDKALTKTGKAVVSRRAERAGLLTSIGSQDRPKRKDTKKLIKELQNAGDVGVLADKMQNQVAALDAAPGIQQAAMQRMVAGVGFLTEKLPRNPLAENELFVDAEWEPNSTDLAKFQRYAVAVDRPLTVLENMANGTVTVEEVEALKTVYPGIYSRLQETIINAITEEGAKVPYDMRITLGTLFDLPTDPSLAGDFMVKLQSTFADEQGQEQGQAASQQGPRRQLELNPEQLMTQAGKITNRGLN